MFENKHHPLLPVNRFLTRMFRNFGLLVLLITISLLVGTVGYHSLEQMRWVEAFYNAALIMSGMGPASDLNTDSGKVFASLYSLYSGLFLVAASGLLLMPVFHRMLHHFHSELPTGIPENT